MVDYPYNYKKPSLAEYLAKYVADSADPEHWNNMDLSEPILLEFEGSNLPFEMTDKEFEIIKKYLQMAIDENLYDMIEEHIERGGAEENHEAIIGAINN